MPGDMKQFPTLPDSDVFHKANKEIESEVKKTETLPEGNGKLKVLKSEMKKTSSFSEESKSISSFLEPASDDKNDKVNCDIKFIKVQS